MILCTQKTHSMFTRLIALAFSLGLAMPMSVFAAGPQIASKPKTAEKSDSQLSGFQLTELNRFETIVFGQPRYKYSEETRIKALEANLLGKAQKGSLSQRMARLSEVLGGHKPGIDYMPSQAPAKDYSQVGSTADQLPKPAPSYSVEPVAKGKAVQKDPEHNSDKPIAVFDSQYNDASEAELLRQGIEAYSQGRKADASRLFGQVLRKDPANPDANYSLGAILEESGDFKGAQYYYQKALTSSPNDSEIRAALEAIQNKVKEQSRQTQNQVAAEQAMRQKALADNAAQAFKAKNYDQAIQLLNQLAQEKQNDATVQFGLAQAWKGKNDYNQARFHLTKAVQLDPNNQLYRGNLAQVEQKIASGQSRPYGYPQSGQQNANGQNVPPVAPQYGYQPRNNQSNQVSSSGDGVIPITPEEDTDPYSVLAKSGFLGGSGNGSGLADLAGAAGFGGIPGLRDLSGATYLNEQYSSTGFGIPGMMLGGGLSSYSYNGSGNSRVRRAVIGGASGAAMGALMNSGNGGRSMRNGAMRGAAYGSIMGLMFGGGL